MPHLTFKGKVFVQNHHLAVPYHELTAVKSKGLSKKASLHDNLIVHGDNLKALKALLPTYHNKVKCIYIDPPYNTGNEGWAYNDKVNSPMMKDWFQKEVDREDLTRHDKWCCMMMPRLKLLREFLTEDGAIFISIDDNEVHHLRCLMDEVFGEENFVASVIWQKRYASSSDHTGIAPMHDYIVAYSRSEQFVRNLIPRSEDSDDPYKLKDEKGVFRADNYTCNKTSEERPNLYYPIKQPNTGKEIWPKKTRVWAYSQEMHAKHIEDDMIYWGKDGDSEVPAFKRYKHLLKGGDRVVPNTWWTYKDVGHTDESKKELNSIFPDGEALNLVTVKPSRLIKRIVQICTDDNAIIMDSFAGSGTTAHAVLALNKEDGGNRRFVCIECEDYADTITAERVRRVIKGVPKAKDESLKTGLGGTFSYFKLGKELKLDSILNAGDLPSYDALAGYVFFHATGEEFDPKTMKKRSGFIGESRLYDVFLIYQPDADKLMDMALTLESARNLPSVSGKQKLVFAPTCYVEKTFLDRLKISFHQLPFQIYQTMDGQTKRGVEKK
jgi:adenine-specific DNA-methyltransferase